MFSLGNATVRATVRAVEAEEIQSLRAPRGLLIYLDSRKVLKTMACGAHENPDESYHRMPWCLAQTGWQERLKGISPNLIVTRDLATRSSCLV
ncbi:MAG: hypothetical protein Q9221_004841 [Calogaya cf. arnoldii]